MSRDHDVDLDLLERLAEETFFTGSIYVVHHDSLQLPTA